MPCRYPLEAAEFARLLRETADLVERGFAHAEQIDIEIDYAGWQKIAITLIAPYHARGRTGDGPHVDPPRAIEEKKP